MNTSDVCPVCGMLAVPEIASVEHHKMYFYFCSQQCRESFVARPKLYATSPEKERDEVVKQRTLRLNESLEEKVATLIIAYLSEMMGVKNVLVDGNRIRITYDLLQVTEKQIEAALGEIGVQLGGGWLERLHRGWVHDSEETELENRAASAAPCCNKPPPGA